MFMECIYYKNLENNSGTFIPSPEECKHLKALRLAENENIFVTNGNGLMAECTQNRLDKNTFELEPVKFLPLKGEAQINYSLAIGRLSNRDRMEFAIEKAIELGAKQIYIIDADHSERLKLTDERLEAKAIAAMKQCKRAFLPQIHNNIKLNQLLTLRSNIQFILLDEHGSTPNDVSGENLDIVLLVGPEGGFSTEEFDLINKQNVIKWKLGLRRLRAETAALCGLSYLVNK